MIFKDFSLNNTTRIRTGYVDIQLSWKMNELSISHEYSSSKLEPGINNSSEKTTGKSMRVISGVKSDIVKVTPVVPDMPVIINSPDEILIPEKHSAEFYIEIPLVLRFSIKSKPDFFIIDIPSEILSKTWFGDISGGILSYSLNSILSTAELKDISPSSAVSRIVVSNKSKKPFRFNKIAVYAQNFSIYESENHILRTNNSIITYLNDNELKIITEKKFPEGINLIFKNQNNNQEINLFKKILL